MMLTVQSVQFIRADMVGPYRPYDDVASDDVVESGWLLKANDVLTRAIFLVKDWVPRGPIMHCHVAPRYWLIVICKMYWSPWGSTPGPPHHIAFTIFDRPMGYTLYVVIYMYLIVFKFKVCDRWQGVGLGLSPDPWSFFRICPCHIIFHPTIGTGFNT
jgi:hypothetical protein